MDEWVLPALKPIRGAAGMVRKLENKREQLGKLRDALRELEAEYQALAESAERAEDHLVRAIDALSEYA